MIAAVAGTCSDDTSSNFFGNRAWIAYAACGIILPVGFFILLFGLPLQRFARRVLGFAVGLCISLWFILTVWPNVSWAPIFCIVVGVIVGKLSTMFSNLGLILMGLMFGGLTSYSVILLGLYVVWDGERWPSYVIIVMCASFFAILITLSKRRFHNGIPGRLQLIPLYTSVVGAVAVVQPINYLSYDSFSANQIFTCNLPSEGTYIFLGVLYGLALIGLCLQLKLKDKLYQGGPLAVWIARFEDSLTLSRSNSKSKSVRQSKSTEAKSIFSMEMGNKGPADVKGSSDVY